MGIFGKFKTIGLNFLGLGQKQNKHVGLVNKAKSMWDGAMSFINNKSTKNTVNKISQFLPGVGEAYKSIKKYANMGNEYVNKGGVEKTLDRFIKKEKVAPTLERRPRKTDEDDLLGGLF